jgi:hypothetical protein
MIIVIAASQLQLSYSDLPKKIQAHGHGMHSFTESLSEASIPCHERGTLMECTYLQKLHVCRAKSISIKQFALQSKSSQQQPTQQPTAQPSLPTTSSTFTQRPSFVPTTPPQPPQSSTCSSPSPPSSQSSLPLPWLRHRLLLAPPPWPLVTLRPSTPCRLRLRASWQLRKQLAAPGFVRLPPTNISSTTNKYHRLHCCSCSHCRLLRCCARRGWSEPHC